MLHLQVVDRGDILQIWREAVSILNKESQITDKGWSFGLEVRRGDNKTSP
jgi:hypothetical protein